MVKKEKPIPLRIEMNFEIQKLLDSAAKRDQGILVEKLIAEFMIKKGIARRTSLESINAAVYSGQAIFLVNKNGEKILKKKR